MVPRVQHRGFHPVLLWEAWKSNGGLGLKKSAQCTVFGLGSTEMEFCQWVGRCIPCGEPEEMTTAQGRVEVERHDEKGRREHVT